MPDSAEQIFEQLKASGFRLTKSRRDLIKFILSRRGHWTVQDLSTEANKSVPGVGVATIYRTVGLLLHQNLLTETRFGGTTARYEVTPRHHHDHLKCITCGEIFEFENEKIEELQERVAKNLGFQLKDHRMELYAECIQTDCQFRNKKKTGKRLP